MADVASPLHPTNLQRQLPCCSSSLLLSFGRRSETAVRCSHEPKWLFRELCKWLCRRHKRSYDQTVDCRAPKSCMICPWQGEMLSRQGLEPDQMFCSVSVTSPRTYSDVSIGHSEHFAMSVWCKFPRECLQPAVHALFEKGVGRQAEVGIKPNTIYNAR